jgi:prepilin-type N-terminal cleavage/methylation domain-containing protein
VKRAKNGFTLIELMLSMSILALAAGIIYASIRTGLDATRKAEEKNDLFQKVRIIRKIVSDDLANTYMPKQTGNLFGGFEELEEQFMFEEGREFDFEMGMSNAFEGRDGESGTTPADTMAFFTIAKGAFESDMPVYVSYFLDDDPGTEEEGLVMERVATIIPSESFRKELAAEIVGMDVRYLDSTPEGQVWLDVWEEKRKLPRAVEVTFTWSEEARKLSHYTDVPIMISISSTHVF